MAHNILYSSYETEGKTFYSARRVKRYGSPGFSEISQSIAYISSMGKIILFDNESVTSEEMEDIHKFANVIKNNSTVEDESMSTSTVGFEVK